MRRNECFNWLLASVSLLSRGWIVPVGGLTPDRHKVGGKPRLAQGWLKDERRNPGQG